MATPPITLYQFPGNARTESISPFCVKAHRILRLKGLPYQVKNLVTPGSIKKVNRIGKLPTLDYGGELIADSTHIARFLEAKHPDPPLFPKDEAARARNTILDDWAGETLYFKAVYFRWGAPQNVERSKQLAREIFKLPAPVSAIALVLVGRDLRKLVATQGTGRKPYAMVVQEFTQELDALDALCAAGPYLLGGEPSLADIAVFSMLDAMRVGATPDAEKIIQDHSRVSAWLKRVDEATAAR
jgi:glutathione S-transferase